MMRRIRTIAIILCISLLLPFMFTSCGKTPKTAEDLIERVEEAMESAGSYEQDMEMDIEVWVSGTKMALDAIGKGILIDTKDDYYYYNKMYMEMTVGNSTVPETSSALEVYDGGNAYFLNEEGGKVSGKYTEATAEDHKAYIEDGGDVEDYIYDCETKEFSKNEDGSWKLVLSDYSDEALEGIYDKAGLSLIFDAGAIRDVETELLIDGDFHVLEYELKFRFNSDDDGNKPRAVIKTEFSKYGDAERKELEAEEYKKVKDLIPMKMLGRTLDRLVTRRDATAKLKINQSISDQRGKETYAQSETDTIKYGVRDDKFFFDMTATINGENLRITYEDGKQTTKANSRSETTEMEELVAKNTVKKILDCTGYDADSVKSFEDMGNGVYEVKLDKKDAEEYKNAFGKNTKLHYAELTATYTLKDGEIVSIEAKGDIRGAAGSTAYTLDISISLTLE